MRNLEKDKVTIKTHDYIVCPQCGHSEWDSMFKKYGENKTTVYCKSKTCNHSFDYREQLEKNREEYSIYVFTDDKDYMVQVLEESLKKLKNR